MPTKSNNNDKYARYGDLTTGSIKGHLFRLGAPMTWGILMVVCILLVDTYFISLLGNEYLTAFTFTFPVTYGAFSLMMGFGIAASSIAARLIGAKDHESLKHIAAHIVTLVWGLSLLLIAGLYLGHDPLFIWLGADENALPIIRDYMLIWMISIFFYPMHLTSLMRAAGDSMTPAIILTLSIIINAIGDPLFIFGWGIIPAMGIKGAAIATVLANIISVLLVFYWIIYKKKIFTLRDCFNFDDYTKSIKKICAIALPVGITNLIQPVMNALIIAILADISAQSVAAFGIATRIEALAFIVLMGLAVGMGPILGQNFGAQKYDRVHQTMRQAILFNIIWSLGITAILGLAAKPILSIFTNDPDIIKYGVAFFMIVPISYVFSNLLSGWSSAMNALGHPKQAAMMMIGKYLILLLPTIYIAQAIGSVQALFIAIAAVNIISGLAAHFYASHFLKRLAPIN